MTLPPKRPDLLRIPADFSTSKLFPDNEEGKAAALQWAGTMPTHVNGQKIIHWFHIRKPKNGKILHLWRGWLVHPLEEFNKQWEAFEAVFDKEQSGLREKSQ